MSTPFCALGLSEIRLSRQGLDARQEAQQCQRAGRRDALKSTRAAPWRRCRAASRTRAAIQYIVWQTSGTLRIPGNAERGRGPGPEAQVEGCILEHM